MWYELTHRLFSVWFFALHLFCMHKRQWMGDDRRDGYWFYGLFIYFFFVRPLLFLLSHTDQHHRSEIADESKSAMTTVRKNRIRVEHPSHCIYVCVFFVCGYKERKKEESSQPFIPWALFSLSGSCYLHIIFFNRQAAIHVTVFAFFYVFVCYSFHFIFLFALLFSVVWIWGTHRAHNARLFLLLFSRWTLHKCFMSKQEITFSYLYNTHTFTVCLVGMKKYRENRFKKILAWVNVY